MMRALEEGTNQLDTATCQVYKLTYSIPLFLFDQALRDVRKARSVKIFTEVSHSQFEDKRVVEILSLALDRGREDLFAQFRSSSFPCLCVKQEHTHRLPIENAASAGWPGPEKWMLVRCTFNATVC